LFLPKKDHDSILFYGTQNVYFLLRFYFTLYERFQKAYDIANNFVTNSKTVLLSEDQKAVLVAERYELFKWVLIHLLRMNIDNMKYEDFIRSIFGNDAYLMFYIDKIINAMIKAIQNLANDDISIKTLNLFSQNAFNMRSEGGSKSYSRMSKSWNEEVYLSHLNYLMLQNLTNLQNTTFFRFHFNPKECSLFINLYESPYKDWIGTNVPLMANYIEVFATTAASGAFGKNPDHAVFLKRNKEKCKRKNQKKAAKMIQVHNIEMKTLPNTSKLVTDSIDKEDFIISSNKFKKTKRALNVDVATEYRRAKKFKAWHKTAFSSLK